MEIRVMTALNQSVNDEIGLFKYEGGRYFALAVSLLIAGGGVVLIFFRNYGDYLFALGVIFILVGLSFSLLFTAFWSRVRAQIIASERKKNPFEGQANLLAVFHEQEVVFTLEKPERKTIEERHSYPDFSGVDITEHYCFFIIGDPHKNPAIPVKKSEEVVLLLKKKNVPLRFHQGSVGH
jgi:hypothetical protein